MSLELWKQALAATSSGVLITDARRPDHPITYVNAGFERMTGYRADEVMGRNCRFLQGRDSDPADVARIRDAVANGRECRVTLLNYRKDGTPFRNELAISPVVEDGALTHYIGIQTDVTARERITEVEDRLGSSEALYETIREGLLVLDPKLRVMRANRSFYRMFETSPEDTEGRLVYELGDGQWNIPALRLLLERILPTKNPFDDFEVRHDFPGVGPRTMLLNARRVDRGGQPEQILLAIDDVTQRVAHAEALRRTEDHYQLLVAGIRDYAIVMLDTGGHVVTWNSGAERLIGYTSDEIVGRHYATMFAEEDRASQLPESELSIASTRGRVADDRWVVRKDGTRFWGSGLTTSLLDERGHLRGFAKLVRDLTERKELEDALRRRADELAARDRAKDEFLAMLSHELRNPLAAASNAMHLLRRNSAPNDRTDLPLEIAMRQLGHLGRLVNDLLDVARVTSGKIKLQPRPISLTEIVEACARSMQSQAEAKGLVLLLDTERPVRVRGDPLRLEQVFQNLIGNAIKFTESGRIEVTVERVGDRAIARVRDSGQGIPPAMLTTVFDLFRQGERSLARSEGGLGIGLTVARHIVDLHGGAIRADSDGIGCGTTVTIELPALEGAVADTSAANTPPPLPWAVPRARVLIVEDNVDSAQSLQMLVESMGYDVRVAHDGETGLDLAVAFAPQLAVLDIGLPRKDGYLLAREMRHRPELQDVYLVALTGYGQEADQRRALECGFDRHLLKPVDVDTLEFVLAQGQQPARRRAVP